MDSSQLRKWLWDYLHAPGREKMLQSQPFGYTVDILQDALAAKDAEIAALRAALEVIRRGSFRGEWELEAKQMSVIASEALRVRCIPSGRPSDATDLSKRNAILRALRGEVKR